MTDNPCEITQNILALLAWLPQTASQAIFRYYASEFDPKRRQVIVAEQGGQVEGGLVVAQTGFDLFRPLAVCTANSPTAAQALVQKAFLPARQYFLLAEQTVMAMALPALQTEDLHVYRLLQLSRQNFQPTLSVLVSKSKDRSAKPLFQVQNQNQVLATAGVNWMSKTYAEVYVQVEKAVQGRGYGRSVVSALVSELLAQDITPLYLVDDDNTPSQVLSAHVGFGDTGVRVVGGFVAKKSA